MGAVEPGELFDVEYRPGKTLQVRALSARQERRMAKLETEFKALEDYESDEAFGFQESMLAVCVGEELKEEILENLSAEEVWKVIRGVVAGARLSTDDEKKSESQE